MKRKFVSMFVFFCLFFLNFSNVNAIEREDAGFGNSGSKKTLNCNYYDPSFQIYDCTGATGTHCSAGENATVALGIQYECNKGECSYKSHYAKYSISNDVRKSTLNFSGTGSSIKKSLGSEQCPNSISIRSCKIRGANSSDAVIHFVFGNDKYANCLDSQRNSISLNSDTSSDIKSFVENKMVTAGGTTDFSNPRERAKEALEGDSTANRDLVPGVKDYAEKHLGEEDFSDLTEDITCEKLLGEDNIELISTGFLILSVIGVLLLIFTGLGDFMAAVTSNEEGSVFKAFGKFKTRIIACVILFLLPALINFALEFINDSFYYETAAGQGTEIKVGNVADCGIGNS